MSMIGEDFQPVPLVDTQPGMDEMNSMGQSRVIEQGRIKKHGELHGTDGGMLTMLTCLSSYYKFVTLLRFVP